MGIVSRFNPRFTAAAAAAAVQAALEPYPGAQLSQASHPRSVYPAHVPAAVQHFN